MKLDFLSNGGGGGTSLPRRTIERRMRQLDIRPLDDAGSTIRTGVLVGAMFLGIFVLFAFLAPISGAAIAPAEVTVAGDRVVVQPVSSGIVTQVLVREGQAVRAGQPVVRLNGVRSGAQLAQAQASRDALRALEARLIAERDGAERIAWPADLNARAGERTVLQAMASQEETFGHHLAVLRADRATTDESVTAARAKQAASAKQLALIEDELADYRKLYARGFARLTTIRSLERTQAQLSADTTAGAAAQSQAEIAQRRVRDAQALDYAGQIGRVQEQLAQVTPQLDVSRYMADQDMLRAPATGRVSGLAQLGPGMVIGGGKSLMEIVPTRRALIVTARVKPTDIDDVRIGQEATVRFSSVNPHGKTAFKGKVVTLSPARIEAQGGAYYQAQVVLDDAAGARREGLVLQPGIPASVNIKTRERSLFEYLLGPLTDAVSRSFREE